MSELYKLPKDILVGMIENLNNRQTWTNDELRKRIKEDTEELEKRQKEKKETRYFKHSHGCGSGSSSSFIKIESMDSEGGYVPKETMEKITIHLEHDWMGGKKIKSVLIGKLLPVDNIYKIAHMKFNEGNEYSVFFDVFIFPDVLDTEWGMNLPIGLYMGNGCRSTEKFQLHLTKNPSIINEYPASLHDIVKLLNGFKYENISQEEYFKELKIYF